ncbi:MAG: hypothetical protein JOZ81_07700 [Chloroflexi bacterium]|nr:hypothetical protein [Chloroflexota bacterium]
MVRDTEKMQDAYTEDSTIQLIVDQVEELVVTLIEEIRERPGVAAAILAAVVGVIIGSALAARTRRTPAVPERVARKTQGAGQVAQLAGIALSLLENPIVRAMILKQLKGRFSR